MSVPYRPPQWFYEGGVLFIAKIDILIDIFKNLLILPYNSYSLMISYKVFFGINFKKIFFDIISI